LLADFRAWLRDLQAPQALQAPPGEPVLPEVPLDLSALLAPFIALRHEVNLQTRASRAQLEQNAQALQQLQAALELLRRPPPAPPATDELLRPALKTLIDVHDALALARREVQRLRESLPAEGTPQPDVDVRLPFWAHWLGLGKRIEHALAPLRAWQASAPSPDDVQLLRRKVDAMLVGYEMGLQRLERALEQSGLELVPCVGEPFDPETMEVAEVVRDAERGGTEVIGELRPGYRWHGRLFRCAQVRVARP
jgi:molecular chaperone GrpE